MSTATPQQPFTRVGDEEAPLPQPSDVERREGHSKNVVGLTLFVAALAATLALTLVVLFAPLSAEVMGLVVIAMSVTLLLTGVHVAVSMALPSLLGAWKLGGMTTVAYSLMDLPQSSAASWTLSVIPLFVLMGLVVLQTGMASVLFEAAKQWIGGFPGGLGVGTIAAGAGLSAASGSTLAVT